MKPKPLPAIYVEFYDHSTGVMEVDSIEDIRNIKSEDLREHIISIMGWIIKETKKWLIVATDFRMSGSEANCKYYWSVFKPAIIERRKIQIL